MEKLKSYGLAAAFCGAALAPVAQGAFIFTLGVNKTHFFTGAYTARFDSGDFSAQMQDGSVSRYFCDGQPFLNPVTPFPVACPLGTTAYVVLGDNDGDGALDGNVYLSLGTPQSASYVEPFEPERITLSASPARLILGSFRDASSRIYYNLFDPTNFAEYDLANYKVTTTYTGGPEGSLSGTGQLTKMNSELPSGSYVFSFPGHKTPANQTNYTAPAQVVVGTFIEAFGQQRYGAGFRFTSGLWDNQYYQMDPRALTKISWTGNSSNLARPGIDSLRYALLVPGAAGDDNDADYLYPIKGSAYYVNSNSTVLDTFLNLPPGSFKVGDLADLSIQFQRNGMNTNIAANTATGSFDVSLRDFRAKMKMVDSYAGWASTTFPQGTLTNRTVANADYDVDGVNNITEYAAEFPTIEQIAVEAAKLTPPVIVTGYAPSDPPAAQVLATKAQIEVLPAKLDETNHVVVQIAKRAFTGTTLTPAFTIGTPDSTGAVSKFTKLAVGPGKAYDFVYRMSEDDSTVIDAANPDLTSDPIQVTKLVKVSGGTTQSVTVNVVKSYWTLRSKDPVADPTAPLPVFKVTVTAKALK